MKKLFIMTAMVLSMTCTAQTVVRNGNVFSTTSIKHSKDTLVTKYKFSDGDREYPIIINKGSGRCYVWKVSSKTNKIYKFYMKTDVSKIICKELGVEFVESKKK